jgi:hypothetical protein
VSFLKEAADDTRDDERRQVEQCDVAQSGEEQRGDRHPFVARHLAEVQPDGKP